MSYDPTEWAPQTPGEPSAQPPVTPPSYGQAPQPPVPPTPPAYGQPQSPYPVPPPAAPTPYGQPPSNPAQPPYGQPPQASNPALPPYGQPPQASNPAQPPYGQPPQASNPALPPYGQPQQASNPALPPYGQPQQASNPALPPYGQPQQAGNSALPPYPAQYGAAADPTQAAIYPPAYGASADPTQAAAYGIPPVAPTQAAAYGIPPVAPTQAAAYGIPPADPTQAAVYPPVYGAPPVDPMQMGAYPQQPAWGGPVPPGYVPPAAPKKGMSKGMVIAIVVIIIVLLGAGGGGGYVLYLATRPKPTITMTSQYRDGVILVGAASTNFTLTGSDFTSNSAITFLLDGSALPGAPAVQSNSKGNVSATLSVTSAWSIGTHTITARDASNYLTKAGVKVEIVAPGKANTPGPNGAPTDTANMSINVTVQAGTNTGTLDLTVNNGNVCSSRDDGQPHTGHHTSSTGVAYTETVAYTCSGTYQGGSLTYTETATQDKVVFADGLICTAGVPYVNAHLVGTFSSSSAVSGVFTDDPVTINCNLGVGTQTTQADTGTWTGLAVVQ